MQKSGFNLSTPTIPTLTGTMVGVVPDTETTRSSISSSHYAVSSIGTISSVQGMNISQPITVYSKQTDAISPTNLVMGPRVPSPITMAMTTSSATTAATTVNPRAPSPSLSEASTGSSNHSLDLMQCKKCSVENCQKVLMVSSKRRKGPVMCQYHRNKTYKAKKRQKEQIATSIQMIKKKHEDSLPKPPNLQAILSGDQPTPSDGLPRLDQVLNEKKLALLRSPTIIQFLRQSQQQLSHSHLQETKPPPAPTQTPTPTPAHGRTSGLSRADRFLHASPP